LCNTEYTKRLLEAFEGFERESTLLSMKVMHGFMPF